MDLSRFWLTVRYEGATRAERAYAATNLLCALATGATPPSGMNGAFGVEVCRGVLYGCLPDPTEEIE